MRKSKKQNPAAIEAARNEEFFASIEQLSSEKGISIEATCTSVQNALISATNKQYRNKDVAVCNVNYAERKFELFLRKFVVGETTTDPETGEEIARRIDPDTEILLENAYQYKSDAVIGDVIYIKKDPSDLLRVTAEKGKHMLRQDVREAEQGQLKSELESRNQELISVTVKTILDSGDVLVSLGKIETKLYKSEQLPDEVLNPGDIVKVYVTGVKSTDKSAKATISRTHPGLVLRLFEEEVPEIHDGLVEIKAVSREAGSRTKIAVFSKDETIDPVGACIGPRGARVNKIVDLLGGEKIDIVKYSEKPEEFIAAALAPADVIDVTIENAEEKSCRVRVPNTQLSLAIGNKGQNARLAAKLTGWKIDIKPETAVLEPETIDFDNVII